MLSEEPPDSHRCPDDPDQLIVCSDSSGGAWTAETLHRYDSDWYQVRQGHRVITLGEFSSDKAASAFGRSPMVRRFSSSLVVAGRHVVFGVDRRLASEFDRVLMEKGTG